MTYRWMIVAMLVSVCTLAACSKKADEDTSPEGVIGSVLDDAVGTSAPDVEEPNVETPEAIEDAPEPAVVEEAVEAPAAPMERAKPAKPTLMATLAEDAIRETMEKPAKAPAEEPIVELVVEEPVVEAPAEPAVAPPPMRPMLVVTPTEEAEDVAEEEAAEEEDAEVPAVLDFTMTTIDGTEKDLADYQGKVILIVNTASRCGYTPQYANLQAVHEYFADSGLAVLGFPANNFGGQEPGTDAEIATFCTTNYGVTFDMFSKISVAGDDRHELFDVLTEADAAPAGAAAVAWNFEKFLIARDGTIVGHYTSATDPGDPALLEAIRAELAKEDPADADD